MPVGLQDPLCEFALFPDPLSARARKVGQSFYRQSQKSVCVSQPSNHWLRDRSEFFQLVCSVQVARKYRYHRRDEEFSRCMSVPSPNLWPERLLFPVGGTAGKPFQSFAPESLTAVTEGDRPDAAPRLMLRSAAESL